MKKRISIIFLAAAAALLTVSCQKGGSQLPEKYKPAASLAYEGPGAVEFTTDGGTNHLTVITQDPVEATLSSNWLTLEVSGRYVYLTAPENNTLNTRYATLTLTSGGKTRDVQVKQYGITVDYMWQPAYEIPYGGGTLNLKHHPTQATVRVQVEGKEWISVELEEGALIVSVAKNPENAVREGSVTWTAGEDVRAFAVKQAASPGGGGGGGGEGGVLFSEDFENVDALGEWLLIDLDGDGDYWAYSQDFAAHSGVGVLYSRSYDNNSGPLTPDNWVFTPAIALSSSDNYLSFWVCPQDGAYPKEHYGVYVTKTDPQSLTNPVSGCTLILEGTLTVGASTPGYVQTEAGAYENHVVKIPSDFDGATVYIAFRHFDCTDWFYLNLDDVSVTQGAPAASSYVPAPQRTVGDVPNAKRK